MRLTLGSLYAFGLGILTLLFWLGLAVLILLGMGIGLVREFVDWVRWRKK